jgi:hypothetical protein
MTDFFCSPDASDDIYRHIAKGQTPQARGAREFTNELWNQTAPFLDPELQRRAEAQFHQSFWEMYLVAAVLDLGLPVRPRCERRFANRGPDLQIGDVAAWIEAVAVTPSVGDDAVPTAELGKVRSVPHDGIKLRLLSGLSEKRRRYEDYRVGNVVRPGEPCVVAIKFVGRINCIFGNVR